MVVKGDEQTPRFISCPVCGHVIGRYNDAIEAARAVEGFRSYCVNCEHVVIPLYLK